MVGGDWNGDGRPDLAVANYWDSTVTILLGDGSGGFIQPAGSPIGGLAGPNSVAVGDFDGDDKLDLAVATFDSHDVTILLGDGGGGFSQPTGSPIGGLDNPPVSIAGGDFNRDGKSDPAVANQFAYVTILLGDGSGGFSQTAGSLVGAQGGHASVAVGDFNRDGMPDLVVVDYSSDNVTILLNTCTPDRPPVARCRNVTVPAGPNCEASASIDDGSFDPDAGDSIQLSQTPPGPYPLGDTAVTLTVTDSHGASSQCSATVTVVKSPLCKTKRAP